MLQNQHSPFNGNNPAPEPATGRETIRPALLDPQISLFGTVGDAMFWSFKAQMQDALKTEGEICLELSTTGGDAETGRRIAEEIRICREYRGREVLFFGKTFIYSAGVTIMAAFDKEQRYLSRDCQLLIHSRRLNETIQLNGPLSSNIDIAKSALANLQSGLQLEQAGFESLSRGCSLSLEEIKQRAAKNWYLTAAEACEIGMVRQLL